MGVTGMTDSESIGQAFHPQVFMALSILFINMLLNFSLVNFRPNPSGSFYNS